MQDGPPHASTHSGALYTLLPPADRPLKDIAKVLTFMGAMPFTGIHDCLRLDPTLPERPPHLQRLSWRTDRILLTVKKQRGRRDVANVRHR